MSQNQSSSFVQSVAKALAVLEVLKKQQPLGLTEIARQANLDKTAVYRILVTLAKYNWVHQDADDRSYRLGLKFLEYGNKVISDLHVRDVAWPFLAELRQSTQETVNLGVLEGSRIVCVDVLESPQMLRVEFEVGQIVQPHCTAMGKSILAHLIPQQLISVVGKEPFTAFTRNTITNLEQLNDELARVRHKGFAVDDLELSEGTRCAGAPIFDRVGDVVGAISVSAPAIRLSRTDADVVGTRLVNITEAISTRLGYRVAA